MKAPLLNCNGAFFYFKTSSSIIYKRTFRKKVG